MEQHKLILRVLGKKRLFDAIQRERLDHEKIGLQMTSVDSLRVRFIDSHTGGEPTLLVVSGGPDLGKGPLAERLERFRDDPGTLDDLAGNHFGFCDARLTAHSHEETPAAGFAVRSVLFETDIAAFLGSAWEAEIFSPTTLLIEHPNRDQLWLSHVP